MEHPHEAVVQRLAGNRLAQFGVRIGVHPILNGGDDEVITGGEQLVDGAQPDAGLVRHFPELYRVGTPSLEHFDHNVEDALGRVWLRFWELETTFLVW
jgi:hypothetical protein